MNKSILLFLLLISLSLVEVSGVGATEIRLVTLGGIVTETVVELGHLSSIVATDSSSTYPAVVAALPKVGYHRALSAEGILAQRPTLVIATTDAGPPHALNQIREAGVAVEVIPYPEPSVRSSMALIQRVGELLGESQKSARLTEEIPRRLRLIEQQIEGRPRPRVLFIYARGGGTLNVAGQSTGADELIELAGGRNAIQGIRGYVPLTSESVVAAAPEVVFMLSGGFQAMGGNAGVLSLPGMALTPAARQRRIITLDDSLALTFGPRLAEGAEALARLLHPDAFRGTSGQ